MFNGPMGTEVPTGTPSCLTPVTQHSPGGAVNGSLTLCITLCTLAVAASMSESVAGMRTERKMKERSGVNIL